MTKLLNDIRTDVETGTSLSVAFRKFPLYFDNLYCNLVEAGESAGHLLNGVDVGLRYIAICICKRVTRVVHSSHRVIAFPDGVDPDAR